MISPQQLANLVKAYQARQAETATVTELDVRDRSDVSKAA